MPKKKTTAQPKGETDNTAALSAIWNTATDFKTIYTNFVQAAFSPLDIVMTLGDVQGVTEGRYIIEARARVVMTPAEAKILVRIMGNTLKNYEAKFGEVVVQGGLMPPSVPGE
jgi:hypothetical protein